MRLWPVIVVAACGSSSPVTTCEPAGPDYNVWPMGCHTFDCHAQICDVTCDYQMSDPICPRLDCTDAQQCRLDCQPGRTCPDVDCTGASACFIACESGGHCSGTCENATSCALSCGPPPSECLLRCGAAGSGANCHMDGCPTTPTDCGGGVYVCNRACP